MSTHSTARGRNQSAAAEKRAEKAAKEAEKARLQRRAEARAQRTVRAYARLVAARQRNPQAYTAIGRPRLGEATRRTLQQELPVLSTLEKERGLIIDPENGRIVVDRTGGKGSVWYSFRPSARYPGPRGEQSEGAGRVMVHNHPTTTEDRPGGFVVKATFSEDDYGGQSSIQRMKPSAAAVVHGDTVAIMRPRADGVWPNYAKEVRPALDRHWAAIDQALVAQARRARSAAVRDALLNVSNADLLHLAWRGAARDTGFFYQRVPTSTFSERGGSQRGGRRRKG